VFLQPLSLLVEEALWFYIHLSEVG
jgi:hypothetical protein